MAGAGYPIAEHHQHRRLFGPGTEGGAAVGHQVGLQLQSLLRSLLKL